MSGKNDNVAFIGSGGLADALRQGNSLIARDPRAAAAQAREILSVDPHQGDALRLLAAALRRMGDNEEAGQVEVAAIKASSYNPILVEALQSLTAGHLHEAEQLLQPYLANHPNDAAAVRMLAEIASRVGALNDSERLLRHALRLAPSYSAARLRLSKLLYQQNRLSESLAVLDELISNDPDNDAARGAKAATLSRTGDYQQAVSLYEQLIDKAPDKAAIWLSYGHLLSTVGRIPDSVAAYRHSIALDPGSGEAWWSLANLKIVMFDDDDIAAMTNALDNRETSSTARLQLHFALGKANEDRKDYEQSFVQYSAANALRRETLNYDPDAAARYVRRTAAVFCDSLFETTRGSGNPLHAPIFVIGMPRAGSTLIEQILASHSQVEGTSELPYMPNIVRRLELERPDGDYPELVAELGRDQLRAIGDEYLRSAAMHRKTDKPYFIDKLPNNWLNIGLIHMILPNARIIDARRHPLGCCFSNFKQHFASGQLFSYSLGDLGRYYADYVDLLAHFDDVLPGKIFRVLHESMVEDSEGEVRRLLDYLGLPFEESCLRFYENDRAVRTPSAGQVRLPINRQGVDQWKAFEPWLEPLKQALGPVLDHYPSAPPRSAGGAVVLP